MQAKARLLLAPSAMWKPASQWERHGSSFLGLAPSWMPHGISQQHSDLILPHGLQREGKYMGLKVCQMLCIFKEDTAELEPENWNNSLLELSFSSLT